jgi:hypothetical protein
MSTNNEELLERLIEMESRFESKLDEILKLLKEIKKDK